MGSDTKESESKGLGSVLKKLTSKKECDCCKIKIEENENESEQENTDSQK